MFFSSFLCLAINWMNHIYQFEAFVDKKKTGTNAHSKKILNIKYK